MTLTVVEKIETSRVGALFATRDALLHNDQHIQRVLVATMSSSEGEDFDIQNISGSESDDFAPVTKKVSPSLVVSSWMIKRTRQATKAPSKPKPTSKAPKTAARPKSTATKAKPAPKKKVLVDHDDNAEDSVVEVDAEDFDASDGDEAGPSPVKAKPAASGKKKTASETYTKVQRVSCLSNKSHLDGNLQCLAHAT